MALSNCCPPVYMPSQPGFVYPSASRGDERPECTVEYIASVYHNDEVNSTNEPERKVG
jgi:hypothetical protein